MLIIYFSIYFLSCGMSDQPWLYRFVCWCWSRIHKVYLVGSATPDSHIHKFVLYYSESEVSITICFMLKEWFHLINWHFKQVPCSCYTLSPALIFIKNEALGSGFTCLKFSRRKHSKLKFLECDMCWLKTFSVESFVRLAKQTSEHNLIRAL